jgi:hypothetical protein
LLDHRYAPFGSSARYRLAMLLYPWQVIRGVELRADTFRLWAREHRTRWSFRLHHPHFEAATESADLGQALCDLARVCAVMAEPFGVPAGRASSEVPGAHPGGPRPLPSSPPAGPGGPTPSVEPMPVGYDESGGRDRAPAPDEPGIGGSERSGGGGPSSQSATEPAVSNGVSPMAAMPFGADEELIDLSDEDRAAIPTRSDEPR